MAELWSKKPSNSEERIRTREKACGIDDEGHQIRSLILIPFRFSPNEFPVTDFGSVADYSRICEKGASRAMLSVENLSRFNNQEWNPSMIAISAA